MAAASESENWSTDDLCNYATSQVEDSESIIIVLRNQRITGRMFTSLSDEDLRELFPVMGDRLEMSLLVKKLVVSESHEVTYFH